MVTYSLRRATVEDLPVLVRHRIRMFEDMGVMRAPDPRDAELREAFAAWLVERMAAGDYVAWVVDAVDAAGQREVVAGGGATILPWPPGPMFPGDRVAFVYNVYTEPAHRGEGLARRLMEAVHDYCRAEGIGGAALNASTFGLPLYESLGYRPAPSPMMFLALD